MHVYVHTHTHTEMQNTHTYSHYYTHTIWRCRVQEQVKMYISVFTCTHAYMHVYVHTHTHTHRCKKHTHTVTIIHIQFEDVEYKSRLRCTFLFKYFSCYGSFFFFFFRLFDHRKWTDLEEVQAKIPTNCLSLAQANMSSGQVILANMQTHISRVSDQNGASPLYIMLEIHHSGQEPSICTPCTCTRTRTHTHTHTHTHIHTHTHTHTHTRKGFWPEWYISTMIYSQEIPFWLETLDTCLAYACTHTQTHACMCMHTHNYYKHQAPQHHLTNRSPLLPHCNTLQNSAHIHAQRDTGHKITFLRGTMGSNCILLSTYFSSPTTPDKSPAPAPSPGP